MAFFRQAAEKSVVHQFQHFFIPWLIKSLNAIIRTLPPAEAKVLCQLRADINAELESNEKTLQPLVQFNNLQRPDIQQLIAQNKTNERKAIIRLMVEKFRTSPFTQDNFVATLNQNPNEHQEYRLLALLLRSITINFPGLIAADMTRSLQQVRSHDIVDEYNAITPTDVNWIDDCINNIYAIAPDAKKMLSLLDKCQSVRKEDGDFKQATSAGLTLLKEKLKYVRQQAAQDSDNKLLQNKMTDLKKAIMRETVFIHGPAFQFRTIVKLISTEIKNFSAMSTKPAWERLNENPNKYHIYRLLALLLRAVSVLFSDKFLDQEVCQIVVKTYAVMPGHDQVVEKMRCIVNKEKVLIKEEIVSEEKTVSKEKTVYKEAEKEIYVNVVKTYPLSFAYDQFLKKLKCIFSEMQAAEMRLLIDLGRQVTVSDAVSEKDVNWLCQTIEYCQQYYEKCSASKSFLEDIKRIAQLAKIIQCFDKQHFKIEFRVDLNDQFRFGMIVALVQRVFILQINKDAKTTNCADTLNANVGIRHYCRILGLCLQAVNYRYRNLIEAGIKKVVRNIEIPHDENYAELAVRLGIIPGYLFSLQLSLGQVVVHEDMKFTPRDVQWIKGCITLCLHYYEEKIGSAMHKADCKMIRDKIDVIIKACDKTRCQLNFESKSDESLSGSVFKMYLQGNSRVKSAANAQDSKDLELEKYLQESLKEGLQAASKVVGKISEEQLQMGLCIALLQEVFQNDLNKFKNRMIHRAKVAFESMVGFMNRVISSDKIARFENWLQNSNENWVQKSNSNPDSGHFYRIIAMCLRTITLRYPSVLNDFSLLDLIRQIKTPNETHYLQLANALNLLLIDNPKELWRQNIFASKQGVQSISAVDELACIKKDDGKELSQSENKHMTTPKSAAADVTDKKRDYSPMRPLNFTPHK